ncbi:ATP/GTP-binding protein [Brachybacterium sp. YJGR34]|uniref:TRAFAC clade GTPase domain-containing protein n=1 Tax=Brachybacterium sp. YJGR34 TaxID=2059911 RepID=UPI001E4A0297|nr:ATP/GTP-binding protein [Brachybacterium sp. YJGR34]
MANIRKLEQHIAVFGQSGSGKTVLLSSFYGGLQGAFDGSELYDVVADDTGQGDRLLKNYYRMAKAHEVPSATRFAAETFRFSLNPKGYLDPATQKKAPFDAIRIVWHDYPGEWFEASVSGAEEERRRVQAFQDLLVSDVALIMVDGEKVAANAGQEERYLKELFHSLRHGLLRLRGDLLEGGKPLVQFPRIWIVALSKADVLLEMTVEDLKSMVLEKSAEELGQLRETIQGMVQGGAALSVGEDFMLLSSATFEPQTIDLQRRIGVDLMLPIAAVMPFERHVAWAKKKEIPTKVAQKILENSAAIGAGAMALALLGKKVKLPGVLALVPVAIAGLQAVVPRKTIDAAATTVGEELAKLHAKAVANKEYLAAILTGFRMQLEKGERDHVLLRSRK